MLFSVKDREDLENLNELVAIQKQVNEVRLQDKLGKHIFHEDMKKLYGAPTNTIEDTFENLTKTLTETSIKMNVALENLNNKLLEIMNDKGIIASYLMSPLSNS